MNSNINKHRRDYYMIVTDTCAYGGYKTLEEAIKLFKKDKRAYKIKRVTEIEEIVYEK